MEANTGITWEPLRLIGTNEKGTTWGHGILPTPELLFGHRHVGAVFGRHWHNGTSEYKCPENFVLLKGHVRLRWVELNTGTERVAEVEAPTVIKVWPRVWHEFTALDDCWFVEPNPLAEHVSDTFYDLPTGLQL